LSTGLAAWFNERVRSALDNSLSIAEAYLDEHKDIIRADAKLMAGDLSRSGPDLIESPRLLQKVIDAQAAGRSLAEAVAFDTTGRVLARSGLSFSLAVDEIPTADLERAAGGEVVVLTSETEDRVRALVRLDGFGDAFLYVARFVDASVLEKV